MKHLALFIGGSYVLFAGYVAVSHKVYQIKLAKASNNNKGEVNGN